MLTLFFTDGFVRNYADARGLTAPCSPASTPQCSWRHLSASVSSRPGSFAAHEDADIRRRCRRREALEGLRERPPAEPLSAKNWGIFGQHFGTVLALHRTETKHFFSFCHFYDTCRALAPAFSLRAMTDA